MTVAPDLLIDLLPAVYRARDAERGDALRQFLALLNEQVIVLDDHLAQLYDDLFAETATPWALPYIAELIGLRGLPSGGLGMTARAEVANTIAYRRRKGTAAVLEQLARDVTGWPARAVECFELLVGTQYVNHIRPSNIGTVDVRAANRLEFVGTAFERLEGEPALTHLMDVRHIANRRGRYNIPNVAIFLWRLRAYSQTQSPAVPAAPGEKRRFLLSPLGCDIPLFTLPLTEDDISHLATPVNVPNPIGRRLLDADFQRVASERSLGIASASAYYGTRSCGLGASILIEQPVSVGAPQPIAEETIIICDLGNDTAGGWNHTPPPAGKVAIDPVLGRIAFPDDQDHPPLGTFHYGFSADVGGGEYDRIGSFVILDRPPIAVPSLATPTIAAGLNAVPAEIAAFKANCIAQGLDPKFCNHAVIEIGDGGRYQETLAIDTAASRVELRAGDGFRPTLVLGGGLPITGKHDGEFNLNGLLIMGGALRVKANGPDRLRLRHCTLVPGIALNADGNPQTPGAPSLIVESANTEVEIDHCILGGLRIDGDAVVTIRNSIVDASRTGIAYAGSPDEKEAGGRVTLENCTVFGAVHARVIALASNTIFLASPVESAGRPVMAEQRQEGCVRFSHLPQGSRTPRRYRCQPTDDADAERLQPVFASERYGDPGYCQLDRRTTREIQRGADDESEMGVFHDLFQPNREEYLVRRLNEYLRFGLEVGTFFAT